MRAHSGSPKRTGAFRARYRLWCERLEDRTVPGVVPVGSEFQVNTYTTSDQTSPSVAIDQAGHFVVAWESNGQDGSFRGVYAQRYDSTGAQQGSEYRVNTHTTGSQVGPATAMNPAGNLVAVWFGGSQFDGDSPGVSAQGYDPSGQPQGGEFGVNTSTTGSQQRPSVAMSQDGNFVVAWHSNHDGGNYDIWAQRYNSEGIPQGGEFRVNTHTFSLQQLPSVAMDIDGDFVVAWQSYLQVGDSYDVFAQRYDSAGIPQGGEFRVNTETIGAQGDPAVAMDGDGNFVVVWGQGGVFARRYHSSGVPQGDAFHVGTSTSGEGSPSIAMDPAGNFVIAYSRGFIFARAFLPDGTPDTAEFRVSTLQTSEHASVAINAIGDFVVSWDRTGISDADIRAQRYRQTAIAQVSGAQINGGATQRSRVTDLSIAFSTQVAFAGLPASAFTLTRIGGGSVTFAATAAIINGVTVVTLSDFTGPETEFGSLADGRYTLTVLANQIASPGGLDGNGNGVAGDDYVLIGTAANGLFRLFGDINGDAVINASDFAQFRGAFGTAIGQPAYLSFLDLDGDGFINAFDFSQFRTRFGSGVP